MHDDAQGCLHCLVMVLWPPPGLVYLRVVLESYTIMFAPRPTRLCPLEGAWRIFALGDLGPPPKDASCSAVLCRSVPAVFRLRWTLFVPDTSKRVTFFLDPRPQLCSGEVFYLILKAPAWTSSALKETRVRVLGPAPVGVELVRYRAEQLKWV